MESANSVKNIVKEKYADLARKSEVNAGKSGCCRSTPESIMAGDYSTVAGYVPDADLGLGCGIPTEIANIKEGQTVLDLGSGAGNDVFVARRIVGESGRVIGVDMTDEMVQKAIQNNEKLGYRNVEFKLGDIEKLPVESNTVDVILSNCVLNLVPDKKKAFAEIFRVLKPGGHFSISDIVVTQQLPKGIQSAAELYVGCVAGALVKDAYLDIIKTTGFQSIAVKKERRIGLSDEVLLEYINAEELAQFRSSGAQVLSITVYGKK